MSLSQIESLMAQVLTLHVAVSAIASASPNREKIAAYLDETTVRSLALLNAKPASDEFIASVEDGITEFRKILIVAQEEI